MVRLMLICNDPKCRTILQNFIDEEGIGKVILEEEESYFMEGRSSPLSDIDIVILDLTMSSKYAFNILANLKSRNYEGSTIILCNFFSKDFMAEAFSLGVEYVIQKPIHKNELLSILQKVVEKEKMKKELQQIQEAYQIRITLTPKELDILALIEKGYTQSEIANLLVVSLKTVKTHITNILRKTGAKCSKNLANRVKICNLESPQKLYFKEGS